jgi:hypothetical protein
MPGTATFPVEVSHVSPHGFWLLLSEEELFLPFDSFPWFRHATIAQLHTIERPTEDHLYWLDLDIDLAVGSIRDPSAYPLIAKPG